MENVEKVTFRCKGNPRVLYAPKYKFEVEDMRKHPDYEEVDANGNAVVRAQPDEVRRIPMSVAPPRATLHVKKR